MHDKCGGLALAMALLLAPVSAQAKEIDRTRLDALVAKADAYDVGCNPKEGMANWEAALAEALRLYPPGHPQVAATRQGIASAYAAHGKMDEATKILDEILPVLEKGGPAYLKPLADAYNTRGYVANFRSNHAEAITAFTTSLAILRGLAQGKPNVDVARQISNLAGVNWEAGRQDDTLALNAEAITMGKATDPLPGDLAVWYANRAAYFQTLGRSNEAIATAREGLALMEPKLARGHPGLSNLYANLGAILSRQGRPRAATPYLRLAFESQEAAFGAPTQNSAAMRAMTASVLADTGNYEEAIAFLDQAITVIEGQLGAESNRALQSHEIRALTLMHLGRNDEALAEQQKVLEVRDRRLSPMHRDRMSGRGIFARIAMAKGDLALAEKVSAEGVAMRSVATPAIHPELLSERGLLLLIRSRAAEKPSPATLEEARDVFAKAKANAAINPSAPLTVFARATFLYLAEVFRRGGDADAAFEAQQWSVRSSVDAAAAAAAIRRAEAANPEVGKAIDARRKLVAERGAVMAGVEAQLAAPKPTFDLAAANGQLEKLDAAIRVADAALGAKNVDIGRFSTVSLAEARARLGKGELFLEVTPTYDRYMVTALSKGALLQYETALSGKTIVGKVDALRDALDPAVADTSFDRTGAHAIYAALITPKLEREMRKTRHLLVSAHGAFGALPFSVLAPESGGKDFLIDRTAVTRLPGAPRKGSAASTPPVPQLLALGDAVGPDGSDKPAQFAMRGGRVEGLDRLPALSQARTELTEIAAAIGARDPQLLFGAAATRQAFVQSRIAPGSVVAFATHGLVSGEFEGLREPALLLSAQGSDDGLLTASDISRMDIPASWVILSACNTAAGSGPDAPSLSGLAQAFILAGADNILATHWPVRDDVARALTSATMRHAASGNAPAEALRLGMRDVRRSPLQGATHPAQWAAFELIAP